FHHSTIAVFTPKRQAPRIRLNPIGLFQWDIRISGSFQYVVQDFTFYADVGVIHSFILFLLKKKGAVMLFPDFSNDNVHQVIERCSWSFWIGPDNKGATDAYIYYCGVGSI